MARQSHDTTALNLGPDVTAVNAQPSRSAARLPRAASGRCQTSQVRAVPGELKGTGYEIFVAVLSILSILNLAFG